jgi:acetylornithine/N-succinyldiaminopimelate aminotransferase
VIKKMSIQELDKKYIANTYARFPVTFVSGKGSILVDEAGKEYIDLTSGIAVNTFGIADEEWQKAVTDQLSKLQHTSNLYYTEPCVRLAELLCQRTEMKKVFFSNSGAEANECAIKVARKYAEEEKGKEYFSIVTLTDSFHGRTITTLAATGQDSFHADFNPLTPGFIYAKANNLDDLKVKVTENKVAAIMFEVVQGEGGVNPLSEEFVKGMKEMAQEQNILLIADEVQIGNGRSGMLYGYMNYGIKPDIVTTAKGLGGGLPIAVTILGDKTADVLTPGLHGSTFGGNPVCCAGAFSILNRIDDKLLKEVRQKSNYIKNQLEAASGIKNVTGMGLMLGVETEKDSSSIILKCLEMGVLMLKAKEKIRLLPPLSITFEELKKSITVIKEACAL